MALASTRDSSGFVGSPRGDGGGFEVAVAMLQGATAAFSWSLGSWSFVFPTLFQPGRKFPHKPPVKRSGCQCPDGMSPPGTLSWTFIALKIEGYACRRLAVQLMEKQTFKSTMADSCVLTRRASLCAEDKQAGQTSALLPLTLTDLLLFH